MVPRRTLPILALSYALVFASSGIQLPLTSTAMAHVGLSMSSVGLMWAARSILAIFGPFMWGVLADRRGDARPFAVAALLCGAALLLMLSTTTTAPAAIILFGVYGLLAGSTGSLLDGMVLTALGDAQHRFGRWRAWGTIGFGVTAVGSAILVDQHLLVPEPRLLFPLCALLLFLGALSLLSLPRVPRPALGSLRALLPVLRQPQMRALFLSSTLMWCSHVGYSSFVTSLATARGLPEWSVGISIGAAIVVEAIMLRESPWFLTRFGKRNIVVGVAALASIRWALTAFTVSPALFIALNALHGITFGLFFATLVSLVSEKSPPEMRQTAQGAISSLVFGLGGGVGALLAGTLLDHHGAQVTWLAMAALAAAAFLVAWRRVA